MMVLKFLLHLRIRTQEVVLVVVPPVMVAANLSIVVYKKVIAVVQVAVLVALLPAQAVANQAIVVQKVIIQTKTIVYF